MGRIEDGEELVEVISNLCEEHDVRAGRIEAIGALSEVEIARFDPEQGDYQTAFAGEGTFDLISLSGNVSRLGDAVVLRLEGLMSVMGPAGAQFVSGQLRSGRAISCEFVLEVFEDLAIERRLDADTGRLNIRTIRRTEAKPEPAVEKPAAPRSPEPVPERAAPAEPQRTPIAGKGMSWKDAVEESNAPGEAAAPSASRATGEKPSAEDIYASVDMEEPLMEAGDILEHPKLGRCRVMKVEDGEFAHVRLPRGRIRKLSLDIVDVEFDREEDGRRVFKAIIGR